jgi:hypothetical protein
LGLIKDFAAKTNFSVLELTQNYVKLANQGFIPTQNELRKLADLANSTGKNFDQLTEAIIDAQTGEFERLKEFGIRASKEGDNVTFAFKGVKTQVDFTNESIREYILSLGDLNGVSGSTEAISATLGGQVSNLGDSYDSLINTIGIRFEGVLKQTISTTADLINITQKLLETNAEAGEKQANDRKKALTDLAEQRIRNIEEFEFRKTKDAEYLKQFRENRTEQQQADLTSYQLRIENQKRAAQILIDDLKAQQEREVDLVRGLSIGETRSIRERTKERLEAAQQYYDELSAKEAKQIYDRNVKLEADRLKNLDKDYQNALKRLKQQEQNALSVAELEKKDKADLIDIETSYNLKRIALFHQYSQKNIEEFEGYNIRVKELTNEKLEYLRSREGEYSKAISDENRARLDIEKEYLDSVEYARQQAFDDEIERQLKIDAQDKKLKKEQEEREKELAKQKRQIAYAVVDGLTAIYNTFNENQRLQTQADLDANNMARKADLANAEGNKQAQATINAKYDAEERRLKREQAKRDKEATLFNMGINIAQAVVEALPNIYLAAVVGGLGAIQLGIVASRPLPKFKDGVERLSGEGTETSDSILARLSKNERVVDAKTNNDYFPTLTAIHNHHIPPEVLNNMVMNYDRLGAKTEIIVNDNTPLLGEIKSMSRKLDNIKQLNIHMDKNGIHAFLETKYSKTEYVNNYVTK